MDRQELYKKMLDEDNTMLMEDNEILRTKLTNISNFINMANVETTEALKVQINISQDYFIGQRSILAQVKKML